MNIKNIIYPVLAGGLMFSLAACQPDDYSMDSMNNTSESLKNSYTVTADGNNIHCSTSLSKCIGIWETSDGRYIGQSCDLFFPFAGKYFVLFGVMENGGITFASDTTWIDITTNSLESLNSDLWTNLTGGVGESKKWVPMDKSYAPYRGSSPVMYMNPDDVLNNGKGITDIQFGTGNWTENWDPGFQSWLIPADSPYMDSYMTFSLSEQDGATVEIFHGETSVTENGKFSLNLDDKQHPTITFKEVSCLHNEGFNDVCANYSNNIVILELSPYVFQVATMRTNSEGAWWIVWNFVCEDVKSGDVTIPNDDVLSAASVTAPTLSDNLENLLFTIEGDDGTYLASEITYLFDEDKSYDLYWWDGTASEWTERNVYGNSLYPIYDGSEFALTFKKNGDQITFSEELSGATGVAEFSGNKIKFMTNADAVGNSYPIDLDFFTTASGAKVAIKTSEIIVVKADPSNNKFFFAVENTKNESNIVNQYLFANLVQKSIFGGTTGPVEVDIDNSIIEDNMWVENGCIRVGFWHYGGSGKGIFKNASKVNLKANQKITVKFKINGGVTWTGDPKCVLIDNNIKTTWEPGCFDLDDAVVVSKDGETTVTLTNTLDTKVGFTNTCLDLSIQLDGYGTIDDANEDSKLNGLDIEITSCIIE